ERSDEVRDGLVVGHLQISTEVRGHVEATENTGEDCREPAGVGRPRSDPLPVLGAETHVDGPGALVGKQPARVRPQRGERHAGGDARAAHGRLLEDGEQSRLDPIGQTGDRTEPPVPTGEARARLLGGKPALELDASVRKRIGALAERIRPRPRSRGTAGKQRGQRSRQHQAPRGPPGQGTIRIALAPKLVLIVASVGAIMAATLLAIVTSKTSRNLIQEFESKGEGIALSLAFALGGNGQGTPSENVGRAKGLLEASKTLNGVSYIYIQDAEGSILAHTFVPSFPPEFVEQNWIEPGELARSGRGVKIAPRKQIETAAGRINAIDVAAPIAHGNLGVVHVGMDWGSIERTVDGLRRSMRLWRAGIATNTIVAGFLPAAAIGVRPIR